MIVTTNYLGGNDMKNIHGNKGMGQLIAEYTQAMMELWNLEFEEAPEDILIIARGKAESLKIELERESGQDESGYEHHLLYVYAGEQHRKVKELEGDIEKLQKRLFNLGRRR